MSCMPIVTAKTRLASSLSCAFAEFGNRLSISGVTSPAAGSLKSISPVSRLPPLPPPPHHGAPPHPLHRSARHHSRFGRAEGTISPYLNAFFNRNDPHDNHAFERMGPYFVPHQPHRASQAQRHCCRCWRSRISRSLARVPAAQPQL